MRNNRTAKPARHHLEIPAPAPLKKGALRVTPLGGLGEIGRNMTVFEHEGKLLIVDAGVLFVVNIVVLGVAYLATSYGLVPMVRWGIGQVREQVQNVE